MFSGDKPDILMPLKERGCGVLRLRLTTGNISAELVGQGEGRWAYDLRVVTRDGHVRRARYDAASLALLSLDGQAVQ